MLVQGTACVKPKQCCKSPGLRQQKSHAEGGGESECGIMYGASARHGTPTASAIL